MGHSIGRVLWQVTAMQLFHKPAVTCDLDHAIPAESPRMWIPVIFHMWNEHRARQSLRCGCPRSNYRPERFSTRQRQANHSTHNGKKAIAGVDNDTGDSVVEAGPLCTDVNTDLGRLGGSAGTKILAVAELARTRPLPLRCLDRLLQLGVRPRIEGAESQIRVGHSPLPVHDVDGPPVVAVPIGTPVLA